MSAYSEMMNHNSLHFYQGAKKLTSSTEVRRSHSTSAAPGGASDYTINVRGQREVMPYCLIVSSIVIIVLVLELI